MCDDRVNRQEEDEGGFCVDGYVRSATRRKTVMVERERLSHAELFTWESLSLFTDGSEFESELSPSAS